jgi:hypothetical protein
MADKGRTTALLAVRALELDEAVIALFVGAIDANGHVAREELPALNHPLWSTRRFRRSDDH